MGKRVRAVVDPLTATSSLRSCNLNKVETVETMIKRSTLWRIVMFPAWWVTVIAYSCCDAALIRCLIKRLALKPQSHPVPSETMAMDATVAPGPLPRGLHCKHLSNLGVVGDGSCVS